MTRTGAGNVAKGGTGAAVKPAVRVAISLLLTAAFLYLFLRNFDLEAAWTSLRGAAPTLIAASLLANVAAFLVRAWRWRHLLAPVRAGIRYGNLVSTTFIGFMVSFLVPFRLGEVVRPVLLARRERLRTSAALGTIAMERVFDMLTLVVLFMLLMLSARGRALAGGPVADGEAAVLLRRGVMATAAIVALAIPAVVVLVAAPKRVVAWLHRLHGGLAPGPVVRGIGLLETFIEGLGIVRRGRGMLICSALSVLHWGIVGLSLYLGTRAFGAPLRFADMFLLLMPLSVGIAMPTPGGVGPYEYLAQLSLTGLWGLGAAEAAAIAVTLHAITIVPAIVGGLLCMWRAGIRPAEVRRLAAAGARGHGPAAP